MVRERRELVAHQEQSRNEQLRRGQQLDERERELEEREASLAGVQAELATTQREVLEMRLATEETWSQLSGALAPASLARSISQVRAKLADHYRIAIEEMVDRQQQLEMVRRELSEQLQQLAGQRNELQQWAERRQCDLEQQAARLIAREQELDRQQRHYEERESRWQVERGDYQSEIRSLLAALREVELAAA
jgi:hypothetical protein